MKEKTTTPNLKVINPYYSKQFDSWTLMETIKLLHKSNHIRMEWRTSQGHRKWTRNNTFSLIMSRKFKILKNKLAKDLALWFPRAHTRWMNSRRLNQKMTMTFLISKTIIPLIILYIVWVRKGRKPSLQSRFIPFTP
jgi:hypothetical protein